MQKFYEAYQFYGYRESEIGGVLTTANQGIRGDTPLIVTYSEKRFFEWHEDDKSVNIRASSGSYGGQRGACLYQRTIGALCQTDYKWVQQQQVEQGKLIIEEKGQNVDKLGWSANRSNTNDEQCGRRATNAGQRKL